MFMVRSKQQKRKRAVLRKVFRVLVLLTPSARNIFSMIILFKSNFYCTAIYLIGLSLRERRVITPVHCRPSPENPSLQLQVNAPSVLVQIAAW